MKKSFLLFLGALLLASCSTVHSPSSNSAIENYLIGTWSVMTESNGILTYVETSYLADGRKCSLLLDFNKAGARSSYVVGKWKLEGRRLKQWAEVSSDPAIKVHELISDDVLDVSNLTLLLQSKDYVDVSPSYRYRVLEERGDVHCRYGSNIGGAR